MLAFRDAFSQSKPERYPLDIIHRMNPVARQSRQSPAECSLTDRRRFAIGRDPRLSDDAPAALHNLTFHQVSVQSAVSSACCFISLPLHQLAVSLAISLACHSAWRSISSRLSVNPSKDIHINLTLPLSSRFTPNTFQRAS